MGRGAWVHSLSIPQGGRRHPLNVSMDASTGARACFNDPQFFTADGTGTWCSMEMGFNPLTTPKDKLLLKTIRIGGDAGGDIQYHASSTMQFC